MSRFVLTYPQPTGGVILLHDTQPSEEKSLLDLKVKKKAAAAPAPVPGQTTGAPFTPARQMDIDMSGTEAAAGVLNAVDEDIEGGEEAEVPDEFEVESEDEAREE